MRENKNPTGYFIIPCCNEEECLDISYTRLKEKIIFLIEKKIISENSRIVFVDDGSSDSTWSIISKISADKYVIGIKLAHNVGHQNALLSGLEYAHNKCDFTITIDADLQQDINAFEKFITSYMNGAEIVYGIRNSRSTDGVFKKTTALCFYKTMSFLGTEVMKNHADYRLISNRALTSLLEYQERNLFLRGVVTSLGFQTDVVYFDVFERTKGKSKYTTRKMVKFALDGITSMSIMPLHLIAILGFVTFCIAVMMIIYFLIAWINGATVPGWTSILCSLWLLGGALLFSIGICGEYIGKTYIESKHRPRYYIEKIKGE